MPLYPFKCIVCKEEFDILLKMSDEHRALHCGIEATRVWNGNVPQAIVFRRFSSAIIPGKIIDVHRRGKYKAILKEQGLVDATPRECLQVKNKSESEHKTRIKGLAKSLTKKIYEKGAINWVLGKENPNGPDKLRRK